MKEKYTEWSLYNEKSVSTKSSIKIFPDFSKNSLLIFNLKVKIYC